MLPGLITQGTALGGAIPFKPEVTREWPSGSRTSPSTASPTWTPTVWRPCRCCPSPARGTDAARRSRRRTGRAGPPTTRSPESSPPIPPASAVSPRCPSRTPARPWPRPGERYGISAWPASWSAATPTATTWTNRSSARCGPPWKNSAALYLHPTPAPTGRVGAVRTVPGNWSAPLYSWAAEAGGHALRILLGGVFDDFPEPGSCVGHMGEFLPFHVPRLDVQIRNITTRVPLRRHPPRTSGTTSPSPRPGSWTTPCSGRRHRRRRHRPRPLRHRPPLREEANRPSLSCAVRP